MQASILVVEDEGEIRDLITLHLEREGHRVAEADCGEQALSKIGQEHFDLMVLDWMLPGVSGLEITRKVRARADAASVLMVTAKSSAQDIIAGLEAGADDYLAKPFDPAILMARVRALIRRRARLDAEKEMLVMGELEINLESYEVRCSGELVALTPSEFKLLVTLANHRGKVLTRDALIEHIQGEGVSVVGRTVDTHVFGLRKKLGRCADVIDTVRGVGYRVR